VQLFIARFFYAILGVLYHFSYSAALAAYLGAGGRDRILKAKFATQLRVMHYVTKAIAT
jgi:hypothetical protein